MTPAVAWRRALCVVASLVALVTALAGCQGSDSGAEGERSPEKYCEAYYSRAAPLREDYLRLSENEEFSLEGLLTALGAPGQLAVVFDGMVPHAPDDIRPETEAVRDSLEELQSNLGEGATDPASAFFKNLAASAAASPSFEAVGEYLDEHCPLGSPIAAKYGATLPPSRTSSEAAEPTGGADPDYTPAAPGTTLASVKDSGGFSATTNGRRGFAIVRALIDISTEPSVDKSTVTTYDNQGHVLATIPAGKLTGDCAAADVLVGGNRRIVLTEFVSSTPARGIEPELWAKRLDAWDAETGEALWHLDVTPPQEEQTGCTIYNGSAGELDSFSVTSDGRWGLYHGGPSDDGTGKPVLAQVIDLETGRVLHTSDRDLRVLGTYIASEGDGGYNQEPVQLFDPETFRVVGTITGFPLHETSFAVPSWMFRDGGTEVRIGLSDDARRFFAEVEPEGNLTGAEAAVQHRLAAYDLPSGRQSWITQPGEELVPVAADGGTLIARDFSSEELVGLSQDSGKQLWRLPYGELCGLTGSQMMLFINGQLAIVDVQSGEQISYGAGEGCPDLRQGGIAVGIGDIDPTVPHSIAVTQLLTP